MPTWTAIALARAAPGQDQMHSRLSIYLHPLAGRPLAWHTLASLAALTPSRLLLQHHPDVNPDLIPEVGLEVEPAPAGEPIDPESIEGESAILIDGASPIAGSVVSELLERGESAYIVDTAGRVCAAHLTTAEAREVLAKELELSDLPRAVPGLTPIAVRPEALVVTDRAGLAQAAAAVRDRLVSSLMKGGTTFLLPESVLVDVDVRIGRDTVVYPGVVIEGETTVGDETVIGPCCRIVDSWIGSGVELKGWNFISRTSVRNRAILEPHVRRGFD